MALAASHMGQKQMWLRYIFAVFTFAVLYAIPNFSADAAEVRCVSSFYKALEETALKPSEATFQTWWPSGFRPTASMCQGALLKGPIEKGDYDKVFALYKANHKALTNFYLMSPGGNVAEAILIGRLFRRFLIRAHAPKDLGKFNLLYVNRSLSFKGDDVICASACSLIWLGSPLRFGTVGVHRPYTDDPAFKNLAPTEASQFYKQIFKLISDYADEMEIPRPLIDALIGTGSSDITWVDTEKDRDLERTPSLAEWVDASCGRISRMEFDLEFEFIKRNAEGLVLSEIETVARNRLMDKIRQHRKCQVALIMKAVDAMDLPTTALVMPAKPPIPRAGNLKLR
jgi:hypothetical protein